MSLESALDEERLEVLRILEGRPQASKKSPPRRGTSPPATQSPVRSMLDISSTATGPKRETATAKAQTMKAESSPTPPSVRSMLDTSTPPPPPPPPPPPQQSGPSPSRSEHTGTAGARLDPERAYQFDMMPTIDTRSLSKRVSQGGKRQKNSSETQPAGLLGSGIHGPMKKGHHTRLSQSPSSRLPGTRSASQGGRRLNTNSFSLMSDPSKFVTDSGKEIDLHNAYRRLSDAALLRSGGSLSTLGERNLSDSMKGETAVLGEGIRMQKDVLGEAEEEAVNSTDDEVGSDESFLDEAWSGMNRRGRGRTRRSKSESTGEDSTSPGNEGTEPKSLLAAAEDERKRLSKTQKVRSLLEPEVTITGPDGEKPIMQSHKRPGVHPTTSFDLGSSVSTPINSDTETDVADINHAQRLAMTMSPIYSSPDTNRVIRQIVRGQYAVFQTEAEQGLRRQRAYLVATDLSEEAAYALEWTIGTVLRDGDSMIAVYAVDEESGTGASNDLHTSDVNGTNNAASISDISRTADTDSISLSGKQTSSLSAKPTISSNEAGAGNRAAEQINDDITSDQPNLAGMDKAERERYRACTEVSERCIKLLRKTRLQIRVVVEVFHCKSPKHMITEVIDFLDPTLVILGSRGRSALKGVLLGSFSNYIVTKSSVPVMVARKRLRKHSKFKRANQRLSNVLLAPQRSLASAKID